MTVWIRPVTLIFILLHLSSTLVVSQTRQQLEEERNAIIANIEATSASLELTSSSKEATLQDLKAIEAQIDSRQKLISTISSQLTAADEALKHNESYLDSVSAQLVEVQADYDQLRRYAYLRRLATKDWLYLLSADGLNDAVLRWRYLQHYEVYLDHKIIEEAQVRSSIDQKNQDISLERDYIKQLLLDEENNRNKLKEDLTKKDEILAELEANEASLKSELNSQKLRREKLNQAIEKIILAELSKKDRPTTSASTGSTISRSSLAWPIDGYVSGRFGNQPHPALKNVRINNNGIDITSTSGLAVRSVAQGTVISISKIPGYDYMIIIQHGDYYSVYSNLVETSVAQLEPVTTTTVIGKLGQDSDRVLHFEWWKGKEKLDPQQWLK